MTNNNNENYYEKSKQDMVDKTYKYALENNLKITKGTKGWNDEGDAFRHAFMQASQTISLTPLGANVIGSGHEIMGNINSNQDPREYNMDTWNNAVGREIGLEVKNEIKDKNYSQEEIDKIITDKVVTHIKAGDLITDLNDKRDYKKDFKNRNNSTNITNPIPKLEGHVEINEFKNINSSYKIPENKVYTFEEIGKMKPEEFRSQQNKILSDFVQRKIIHEDEAKAKVQTGELIYVQPYQRADGTEVKGYYRRR